MRNLIIVLLLLFSCSPPSYKQEREPFYTQDFSEPVAFVAVEWNSRTIEGTGSSFLIDKEKGLLLGAKHVSDIYKRHESDSAKIFIDGHVYDHFILQEIALKDASLLRLVDFDPNDLPEPYPISQERIQVGDVLYIRGFHRHPNGLMKINRDGGNPDVAVPIIEEYYENFGRSLSLQSGEVVYHNIRAEVTDTNAKINLETRTELGRQKNEVNEYIRVTTEDHKFSFGGLSGGVAINAEGEIVGIITAEQVGLEEVPFVGPFALAKKKYETIFVTSILDIQELLDYAQQVR